MEEYLPLKGFYVPRRSHGLRPQWLWRCVKAALKQFRSLRSLKPLDSSPTVFRRSIPRSCCDDSQTGLYSVFADRAALDKYAVSDAHMKVVVENVKPNTEGE